MRKLLILSILTVFALSSVSFDAEAKKRRRNKRAKRGPIINEPKLYERIGGVKSVSEIVDEWVRANLADPRVAALFEKVSAKPDRLQSMRRAMNDQLCEIADGPCKYRGQEMDKAHSGLGISDDHFLYVADNLHRTMTKLNIPEREKNEMMGRIGEYRAEIVESEIAAGMPSQSKEN